MPICSGEPSHPHKRHHLPAATAPIPAPEAHPNPMAPPCPALSPLSPPTPERLHPGVSGPALTTPHHNCPITPSTARPRPIRLLVRPLGARLFGRAFGEWAQPRRLRNVAIAAAACFPDVGGGELDGRRRLGFAAGPASHPAAPLRPHHPARVTPARPGGRARHSGYPCTATRHSMSPPAAPPVAPPGCLRPPARPHRQ